MNLICDNKWYVNIWCVVTTLTSGSTCYYYKFASNVYIYTQHNNTNIFILILFVCSSLFLLWTLPQSGPAARNEFWWSTLALRWGSPKGVQRCPYWASSDHSEKTWGYIWHISRTCCEQWWVTYQAWWMRGTSPPKIVKNQKFGFHHNTRGVNPEKVAQPNAITTFLLGMFLDSPNYVL